MKLYFLEVFLLCYEYPWSLSPFMAPAASLAVASVSAHFAAQRFNIALRRLVLVHSGDVLAAACTAAATLPVVAV